MSGKLSLPINNKEKKADCEKEKTNPEVAQNKPITPPHQLNTT